MEQLKKSLIITNTVMQTNKILIKLITLLLLFVYNPIATWGRNELKKTPFMRYFILLFALAGLQTITGQSSFATAYNIGTLSNGSTYTDTKNTSLFSNTFNQENGL